MARNGTKNEDQCAAITIPTCMVQDSRRAVRQAETYVARKEGVLRNGVSRKYNKYGGEDECGCGMQKEPCK